jgi:hypothetical protein
MLTATAAAPRVLRDRRYSSMSWRRARDATLARDGYTCQACGRQGQPGDRWLVADHKTPPHRYAGMFADPDNLWTLCKACNNSEGDRTVEEWRGRMDGAGAQSSLHTARSLFTTSEAEAARELGRIRAAVAAWRVVDHMAWPVVDSPPTHDHSRWASRHTITSGRQTWDVCPPAAIRRSVG